VVNSPQCKQLSLCFLSVLTTGTLHCSKLSSTQTARLAVIFFEFKKLSCNTVVNSTQLNNSAGTHFQSKQLGWYAVVSLLYFRANSWTGCFLSVRTVLLVHCINLYQCKQLHWHFPLIQTDPLAHCSKFISVQTELSWLLL